MTKRLSFVATMLAVLVFANASMAQIPQSDCLLGVYADAEGTMSTLEPTQGEPFNTYTVMFLEGLVNAVSYRLFVPKLNEDIFLVGENFGPAGRGINIQTPGGYNIGIGECAIGFSGFPILIHTTTFVIPGEATNGRSISVGPNLDYDPEAPLFAVCTGEIYRCTINDNLLLTAPISIESPSFGAVKSLYGSE